MNGYKRHNNEGAAATDEKKWKEKVKGKEYEETSGKEHCKGTTGKKMCRKEQVERKSAGKSKKEKI